MRQIAMSHKLATMCTSVALLGVALAFAPSALAADNSNLASLQAKVPFTIYAPKFTAQLPLRSVQLKKFDEQAVGPNPGPCTRYLTAQYGPKAGASLQLTESFPCQDPGFPFLEVESFLAKGNRVFITTKCPNANAIGHLDCQTGSTATPAQLLQAYGEAWIALPARGQSKKTQAQLYSKGLNADQIKKIIRSLVAARP